MIFNRKDLIEILSNFRGINFLYFNTFEGYLYGFGKFHYRAAIEKGDLSFWVDFNQFYSIISTCNKELEIKQGKTIQITSGNYKARIPILDSHLMLEIPEIDLVEVDYNEFYKSIKKVDFTQDVNFGQEFLKNISLSNNKITITDGKKILVVDCYSEFNGVLPIEIIELLPKNATSLKLGINDKMFLFEFNNYILYGPRIQYDYPDCEMLFAGEREILGTINKDSLSISIKRMIKTNEKIALQARDNVLYLKTIEGEAEDFFETTLIDFDFLCNGKKLLDIIERMPSEITIEKRERVLFVFSKGIKAALAELVN